MVSTLLTSNGSSSYYADLYADMIEWVQDATFPTSPETYSRMRVDPQCAAVLKSYTLPIRRAEWSVDPAGCSDEVVERVADDLGLPVLGTDPAPGPARRRGVRWKDHLRLAASGHLTFGFMPFEREYDQSDGRSAHLIGLHERMPVSIGEMKLTKTGALESVLQTNSRVPIPRGRLAWYVNDREGSAWQGQSALRHAFAPWIFKHETWRVHSTSIRRFGMGVPYVEAPPGATAGQVAEAARLAQSMRAGENAGAGLPPGFKMALAGLTGSVPDAMAFIQYLDQQISRGALAGMMDLGNTPNGSRALGAVTQDNFMLSLQATADHLAETATVEVVVPLVDTAFGEDEPAPRIVVSDVGANYEVTSEAIQQLIDCGALVPDVDLENYLRGIWKLPAKQEPITVPAPPGPPSSPDVDGVAGVQTQAAPGVTPPVAAAAGTGGAVTAAAGGSGRRALTEVELRAATDFDVVQGDWTTEVNAILAAWGPLLADMRDALVEQVRFAYEQGDMTLVAALSADSSAARDLLAEHMETAAFTASREQSVEAASQGVSIDPQDPDLSRLQKSAAVFAALYATGLAQSAGRKAAQAWNEAATPAEFAATVRAHLDSLTDSAVRDYAGAAVSTAQNEGRLATLRAAPDAKHYASEALDGNTCAPCAAIDGTQFASLDDAEQAYSSGGYAECRGGLRCRGLIVTVWDD